MKDSPFSSTKHPENQCSDSIRNLIGDAGNDTTSIRVPAENYVRQLFPLNEIHDIGDMSREIDGRRIEVRPFAQASKGRGEYVVSGRLKRRANALPTPASVPGGVDENISCLVIPHEGLALPARLLLPSVCPLANLLVTELLSQI